MSDNNKWESNSEDLDDEDLVMTEGGDEEDEERYNNSVRSFYPEDFTDQASSMSPQYSRNARDFSRFDLSAGSPLGWNEAIDEKGEAVTLMMHLEKTIVHQKFFNNFDDDFDEDDLA